MLPVLVRPCLTTLFSWTPCFGIRTTCDFAQLALFLFATSKVVFSLPSSANQHKLNKQPRVYTYVRMYIYVYLRFLWTLMQICILYNCLNRNKISAQYANEHGSRIGALLLMLEAISSRKTQQDTFNLRPTLYVSQCLTNSSVKQKLRVTVMKRPGRIIPLPCRKPKAHAI